MALLVLSTSPTLNCHLIIMICDMIVDAILHVCASIETDLGH